MKKVLLVLLFLVCAISILLGAIYYYFLGNQDPVYVIKNKIEFPKTDSSKLDWMVSFPVAIEHSNRYRMTLTQKVKNTNQRIVLSTRARESDKALPTVEVSIKDTNGKLIYNQTNDYQAFAYGENYVIFALNNQEYIPLNAGTYSVNVHFKDDMHISELFQLESTITFTNAPRGK